MKKKKNEAELYVMIWKDAYDIPLSEQKANCETKCLVRSLFGEKKKKICRSIHTHTPLFAETEIK